MASAPLEHDSRLVGLVESRPFWRSSLERFKNMLLLPASLPGLIRDPARRALFQEARSFVRLLPERLREPLPAAVKKLEGYQTAIRPTSQTEKVTRDLADLASLLQRRSPLGICMRRSLTRYYFLRRAGLPLQVHFGARFVNGKPDRDITGHAWLTLDGKPYHEPGQNWRGFTVILTFPQADKTSMAAVHETN